MLHAFRWCSRWIILITWRTCSAAGILRLRSPAGQVRIAAIAALVAQGFGLAIVPYDEQLRACGVELLSLDETDAFRTYYLARSRTRTPSEAARAFWQFTLEHAEAE